LRQKDFLHRGPIREVGLKRNAVVCLLALGRTKLGIAPAGGEFVQAMLARLFVAGLNTQFAPGHSGVILAALGTIMRVRVAGFERVATQGASTFVPQRGGKNAVVLVNSRVRFVV
jgi:hypothetical protein